MTRVKHPALLGLRIKGVKVAPVVICARVLADFDGLRGFGVEEDTLAQTGPAAELFARNLA